MTAITSISFIFGRDMTKTAQLRLRGRSESIKPTENVSLSNQLPHFHCLLSGSETDDYLLLIAPNRRYKKDYNQYQRDLAAKAKDQCQNKSAKSADTNTKAKDRCQDKSAKSANTTTKPKGRRSLKATKRAAAKLKPKPKPISAIELARAIPETGIHSSALLAIFVGRIGDLPGQTPKRAFFDMVKKNGKYSADKLLRPNEFPNIFRQHTKKETE
jgi:hypothetical protein